MQFAKSKAKLDQEHEQRLKAQVDLRLATGQLMVIKKQLMEAKLKANQLII